MKAIAANKPANVQYLLENGATPTLQNACGRSAYDFAETSRDDSIIALLKDFAAEHPDQGVAGGMTD